MVYELAQQDERVLFIGSDLGPGVLNDFKKNTGIPLDPIYTGKLMYGLLDMVKKGKFKKGTKILAIHTGGLQGILGMNENLKKKNLPLICV